MTSSMTAATRWTLIIVGLLAGNLVAMAVLVGASRMSSAQVIPGYYERAVRFDDQIDEAERARQLGWRVDATIDRDVITVVVVDAAGLPIVGRVHVRGFQRAHAANRFEVELPLVAAGRYRLEHANERGVHDLEVVIERDTARFVEPFVIEVR